MSVVAPVRRLDRSDRSRWDVLWAGYLDFYRCDLPQPITEYTWQRLLDPQSPLCGFVAVDRENRAIGFAHCHVHLSTWSIEGYCYLEDLFVDPRYRGQGTGRALIEAVYRLADERGAKRVYWHTERDNELAQKLYRQVAQLTPFVQYRR